MIREILPYMRCPRCTGRELQAGPDGLACMGCGSTYALNEGVLDMLGSDPNEVITPFQRVMQTRLVVTVYEKFWRRIGYWLASSRSFSKEMQTVLRLARGRSAGRTLDLACGPGIFTRPIAAVSNGWVVGLDLSRPMLAHAHRKNERERVQNVFLVRASAFALPFADGAFRFVNCCGALHLFDRPEAALEEIARVLEPAGCLSIQTTIRPERSAGLAYILERFIRFGFFDEGALTPLLGRYGFRIMESERHRISYTFLAGRANPATPPSSADSK